MTKQTIKQLKEDINTQKRMLDTATRILNQEQNRRTFLDRLVKIRECEIELLKDEIKLLNQRIIEII